MAIKKTTFINTELSWAEEQLHSWKSYVDANPLHELKYRVVIPEHISKNKKHYLYCHFKKDYSSPFYVGIGTHGKIKTFTRSKSKSGRNKYWKNIAKDGYIILICNESDDYEYIKELEKELIFLYNKDNLTNLTDGGEGCKGFKHSVEHINKIKENYKLGKCSLRDRIISEEERVLKSKMYKGEGNPNYGKIGFLSKVGKPVVKIDCNGEIIKMYGSIRNASIEEGVSHTSIIKAIKKNHRCNNYYWKFK